MTYKPPTPQELAQKTMGYKPPTPQELDDKTEKARAGREKRSRKQQRRQEKEAAAAKAKTQKKMGYKVPTPQALAKKTTGYKPPSPGELSAKIQKQKDKDRKKAEREREKGAGVAKRRAKKRAGGGQAKKPPKQLPKPGGSKEKAKVDRVPAQLAHCVVAVQGSKGKGGKKHSTRAAWNICRWSLTRYGYLKPPYKKGAQLKNVRATQKGVRRTMKHAMEPEAPGKYKRFKDLFREIEPTV
jgi:hypothetical protein